MKHSFILGLLCMTTVAGAQVVQDSLKSSPFTVSGYVEAYYLYDFNQPTSNTRPPFVYAYNRHNEVAINLAFIRGAYATDQVRANLAVMTGTYANANLAAEPGVLKNIYEANAGVRLSAAKNVWVDAGIFSSHIGFESAVGKDCWTLTRSIMADNTPYYEAGAKVSYTTDNGKWFVSGLILNGWQRIQRMEGNSLPSFGTQVTYKPSDKITLNSSTFIGTDKPDSARQLRYFHNLYGILQVSKVVGITLGVDYGLEEKSPETTATNTWICPIVMARFTVTDKLALAVRGEYYDDKHGMIIATGTPNGFRTTGVSANVDYQLTANAVWRIEARHFTSKDAIFDDGHDVSKNNTFVATALAISF
jgi:hypothetical protein